MPGPDPHEDPMSALESGAVDPIYCLHGGERFLIDRYLGAIRRAVLDPRTASFNHDVFDARESGLAPALAAARTVPMMAKKRLVVLRGIDELKAEQLEALPSYVQAPNPTTCLVLIGDKVDTRLRAFLALRRAGYLHELKPLRDRELVAWIAREARERGLDMDPRAAQAVAEASGPELSPVAQVLEQLALYAGESRRIRLEDVEELVPETRQRSVFELTKAIGAGDRNRALALLARMLRGRQAPLYIQTMLARQVRQVARARELLASRTPRDEIARKVGISPYFLDDVLGPARRMSRAALERSLLRLYESDRALKSSRVDQEIVMSRLVQRLAEDAAAPPGKSRPSRG